MLKIIKRIEIGGKIYIYVDSLTPVECVEGSTQYTIQSVTVQPSRLDVVDCQ